MNLKKYQDIKYREFQKRLIVSSYPLIGVRIPILRKISRQINVDEYIDNFNPVYYEDILLYGMVIAKVKDDNLKMGLVKAYIKYIDCWSICDTFCSNLSFVRKDLDKYFKWVISYLEDDRTFYIRFGLVMLLKYYADENYIKQIFNKVKNIKNDEYYCQMGIAWLMCELAVRNKNIVDNFMKSMPKEIQKMYERKVKDSFRVN